MNPTPLGGNIECYNQLTGGAKQGHGHFEQTFSKYEESNGMEFIAIHLLLDFH